MARVWVKNLFYENFYGTPKYCDANTQHHHYFRASMTDSRPDLSKEPSEPPRSSFIALAIAEEVGFLAFGSTDSSEHD